MTATNQRLIAKGTPMEHDLEAPDWQRQARPPCLFRRFTFANYAATRAFLDRLAALSEQTGCYPDIGFGPTYANITINAADGKALSTADVALARRVGGLASSDSPAQ